MNMELTYQGRKEAIKTELNRVSQSFVGIGYQLKQIRDNQEYLQDGYSNINEFAKAEYNLSQSSTSRFIAINDNFSINGNSTKLLTEYENYGYSKLSEMLTLSEEEMKLVTVRTTVAEMRIIKERNREVIEEQNGSNYATSHKPQSPENTQSESYFYEPKLTLIPSGEKILIDFFSDKSRKNILKEIKRILADGTNSETVAQAAELINPSGHLMHRTGASILMFEEDHIKYNKFGGTNQDFYYADLLHDIYLVFDMSASDPWVAFYGVPEEPKEHEESKPTKKKDEPKPVPTPKVKSEPDKEILPGQKDIYDYPEYCPDQDEESEDETEEETEEEQEEAVEVIEADIVQPSTPSIADRTLFINDEIEIKVYEGELQLLIKDLHNIQRIKAIDCHTGNIWSVETQ